MTSGDSQAVTGTRPPEVAEASRAWSEFAPDYPARWNEDISLTKRTYTMSDLLNVFSAAGLWIETAVEPELSEEAGRRYPHKRAWMDRYLGILLFKLRPLPSR